MEKHSGDKRIRKKKGKSEPKGADELLEKQLEEEEEIMRQEKELNIRRPHRLPPDRRRFRSIIRQRDFDERARAKREETDEDYRQKREASRLKGEVYKARRLSALTDEQKRARSGVTPSASRSASEAKATEDEDDGQESEEDDDGGEVQEIERQTDSPMSLGFILN